MKNKTSTVKSGLWQLANVLLFSGIQLAFYGYFARVLTKADFGIIAIANVFIGLSSVMAESGMGSALIFKQETEKQHYTIALFSNIAIGVLFWVILYFSAESIAAFYDSENLTLILRVMSFGFVIRSFGSVSNFLLQKDMKFKKLFIVEVVSNIVSSVAGILASLYWDLGIWALIYSILLMILLNSIGYSFYNKEKILVFSGIQKKHFSDLFSFGLGLTLVRLSNFFATNGVNFLIGKLLTLTSLGVFERMFKIMILPGKYLGNVLDKVMFPSMSRFNDSQERLYEYYRKGLVFVNAIMFPATLLLILFSKEIIYILLGEKWLDSVTSLRILFLCLLFRVSIRMCDSVIRAKGLVYRSARNKFINAVFLALLVYVGHYWGVNGICVAMVIYSINSYFTMSYLVQKSFDKKMIDLVLPFVAPLKYAFLVAIIAIPTYYFSSTLSVPFLLPAMLSSLALMLAIGVVYLKYPQILGEDILWIVKAIKKNKKS